VSGEGSLDGNFGGFRIADFADQHHVGIVAQDGAQAARKGQPGFFRDLDLVDSFQPVLDRVFDRDDLAFDTIDFLQRRVQRCGLAAARRAGHQNDAVGQAENALQQA
jgi:hypothetical protein